MKKFLLLLLVLIVIVSTLSIYWISNANNYQRDGTIEISINDGPIKIVRDEYGIPYVFADSKADLFRGQAFVTAQDRLFQIEFYRAIIKGEAAKIVGSSMISSDIQMRVLGLYENAKRSYEYLDQNAKKTLDWYCEGFNEYLKVAKDEYPLELKLLGIEPKPLEPVDIVSVTHFIGLFHSQNMSDEILSLNLASRMDNASELNPLSVNLDRTKPLDFKKPLNREVIEGKDLGYLHRNEPMIPYPKLGSNNWAISGDKSKSGKPILCNDPHVDARMLPGTFYPIGLNCPNFKAVGIGAPGIPGLISGRNEFVSFGVTNAYGDSQDLFIEESDGDLYMEKGKRISLKKRKEVIEVKDSSDIELNIRYTVRGPVISDFPEFNIMTDDVVSLRWSLAETKSPSLGFDRLLESKNVEEFRTALEAMDVMFFNYAIADTQGNIAHQSTGLVPIREGHAGAHPQIVDTIDSWVGFIPKNELPNMVNPDRNWIGTANHDTRPDDYPYYYSNHFSPFYRYKRLHEVLGSEQSLGVDELWELIFDVKNMQAETFAPLFISALNDSESTQHLGSILSNWDRKEDIKSVGASVYNVLYNELLFQLLNDELPDELENQFWGSVYYWNQRVDSMILTNHSFIDNIDTKEKETLTDLIIKSGEITESILSERLGPNSDSWEWGKIHTVEFASPIRPKGFGSKMLGAEKFPKAGSNQTLNRGGFIKNSDHEFETSWFSSFRMVADMADQDKMIGILSGGSASRIFHPYHKSQLKLWNDGEWIPYWISEDRIMENKVHELILE